MQKSQASMEYLFVVGFAMILVIPVVLVFYFQSQSLQDAANVNQARKVARDIVDAGHSVYYLGEPSQTIFNVNVPENVEIINISGREINFQMNTRGGRTDIFEISDVNLTGSISKNSGIHKIKIQAESRLVNITDLS